MNLRSPQCRGWGSDGQIPCDLMNLRGRQVVRFLFLAANEKNCEQEGNSQQRETRRTPYLDSKAIQDWSSRVTLPDHGKRKLPFSRGPSTGQALGEKWGLPEKAGVALAPVPSAFQAEAPLLPRWHPNRLQGRRARLPSASRLLPGSISRRAWSSS